ncbi:MAG: hypothetical protein M1838_006114 [Thelocarpon superellum]|nr:MAG: hypothetical protein M1838_006114 [Thelocarpon superellum]
MEPGAHRRTSSGPFQSPSSINAVPQIFGAYGPDGSPIPPALPGPIFPHDPASASPDESSADAKRRRIAKACDMCRKKKIKCDGKMPSCTHCLNYKTECIFTQVEKKRNPPKGAKYIEGLENRLGRMESLLRLSGLISDEDDGRTDLGTLEKRLADRSLGSKSPLSEVGNGSMSEERRSSSESHRHAATTNGESTSPPTTVATPDGGKKNGEEVEALSDMMCSLVTNNCGSSSGFSIFSPKGFQWVNEKVGDSSFQDMFVSASADDKQWIQWKPEVFNDIFVRRTFQPLPPKEEALSLLKDFFENFNCMFPLFHEPTFMRLVDQHYSRESHHGSGWWASLNTALAIAHRLRVMSHLVPTDEDQKAWGYLKNALSVMSELTMRNTDLMSVQALLGMSLFLQGTPNPQPSFFMVAAAIRLSHSIGLHKRSSGFNLTPVEIEQRKRVFWIGYMVDKDICLRSGRPPAQDDDDYNVELPSEDPDDDIGNIPLGDGKGKVNLFRLMCTFALIESKVYRQLYSAKASKRSDGELLNTIGELDNELEEWKNGIPIDIRPEYEIKASHTPLVLHIVVLHFAYFNCLTTIHRMSVHHGYWTSRLSNFAIQGLNARPLNPRVFSSAALCVSAARSSIQLLKFMPQGDFSLIIYFPVSSLVTLFANILQNPQDARARADVRLMNSVVTFLSMLSTDEENSTVKRMLSFCSEFERIAKVVIERADKETSSRRKRKTEDMSKPTDSPLAPKANVGPPAPAVTPAPGFSPGANVDMNFTPMMDTFAANGDTSWMSDFSSGEVQNLMTPASGLTPGFTGVLSPSNLEDTSMNMGAFQQVQQPFVPPDLWQMLEWDWGGDLTGNSYPHRVAILTTDFKAPQSRRYASAGRQNPQDPKNDGDKSQKQEPSPHPIKQRARPTPEQKSPPGFENFYHTPNPMSPKSPIPAKSDDDASPSHTASKLTPEEEKLIDEWVSKMTQNVPKDMAKTIHAAFDAMKKEGIPPEVREILDETKAGKALDLATVTKLVRISTTSGWKAARAAVNKDQTGPSTAGDGATPPPPPPPPPNGGKLDGANKGDKKQQPNISDVFKVDTGSLIMTALVLYIIYTLGPAGENAREITWQEFRTTFFDKGLVEKLTVVNGNRVRVDLHRQATAQMYPESPASQPNFHYYFTIGSVEAFERRLDEAQRELGIPSSERIPVAYTEQVGWLVTLFNFGPTLLLVGTILYMSRRASGGAGGQSGIFGIGKSRAKMYNHETDIKVKFKDVAGMDEAKQEIMEFVSFLKEPGMYQRLGAKIPRGAILSGPPGTGKTLLAKATAGESSVPFFSVTGSEFVEMFVGVGPSRVRDLFAKARKNSPCIIFIDEIDAIGKSRAKQSFGGGNDERESTLNQILTEMDGFNTTEQVVVLAGTNRPDVLDKALMRPGRFDRHIAIDRPTMEGRKQIFKVHVKKIVIGDEEEFLAGRVAALTPGFSGADIANCVNEAALIAARTNAQAVEMKHFEQAIERVIGGLEKKSLVLNPEEKRTVAYHEAGHAICGWYFKYADPLLKVSIMPRGQGALGYAQYLPQGDTYLMNVNQLMDRMAMTLGGRVSEELHFETVTSGASDDFRKVTGMATAMVTKWGMSSKIGYIYYQEQEERFQKPFSEETAKNIDSEVRRIVDEAYKQCRDLLTEKKDEVGKVAEELLSKEVLGRDDMIRLLGKRPFEDNQEFSKYFGAPAPVPGKKSAPPPFPQEGTDPPPEVPTPA